MRGPSYVTITFNINPGVIKGDLLFIFSSEPLIQIVTNPKISSDNYWIDYTDALLAMDSEVYIGFDESISESVSFDGLECDGSFLTPGTDFD
ncbi:MAG: hypothetical protein MJ233_05000 [Mycoplasmoidaceae bacterium]|nr:hypothetical protein [Mycoplasmoidaceae bacterium]